MPAETSPADDLRRAGTYLRETGSTDLGDLLMAIADEMADYPAVHVPNGIGLESQPNRPSAVWTAAHRVAMAEVSQ